MAAEIVNLMLAGDVPKKGDTLMEFLDFIITSNRVNPQAKGHKCNTCRYKNALRSVNN